MTPHLSYSGLIKYLECPFKYKIRYFDKILFPGNIFTAFGHSVHLTCENGLLQKISDYTQFFQDAFEKEISELPIEYKKKIFYPKTEFDKGLEPLLLDMMKKGGWLSEQAINSLHKQFGDFKIINVEHEIIEPITSYDKNDYDFKGIVDLVIQTKDGKYNLIDWKTTSWGWKPEKKTDKLITYQLSYYKHFYSLSNDVKPIDVNTWFALIKRTAFKTDKLTGEKIPKDDIIEFVPVSNGPRKINNALKVLDNVVYNVDHKNFIKNKTHCKMCDFYKTEYCNA